MAGKNKVDGGGQASPVNKALTPEEQSIIANIQSLLNQIGQEQVPEEPAAPEGEVAMSDDGDEDDVGVPGVGEEGDEDDVMKSEDASAGAEERMSELPDDDKEALSVLKALMRVGSVQKAARPVDPTLAALQQVTKALRSLQRQADEQGQAIVGILEGFGMADATVRKSERQEPRRVAQSGGADVQAVLKALAAQVKVTQAAEDDGGTLADALTTLVSGR